MHRAVRQIFYLDLPRRRPNVDVSLFRPPDVVPREIYAFPRIRRFIYRRTNDFSAATSLILFILGAYLGAKDTFWNQRVFQPEMKMKESEGSFYLGAEEVSILSACVCSIRKFRGHVTLDCNRGS